MEHVDLSDVELDDGPELARFVTRLRERAARAPLRLVGCPQMLAHTLYKAGLLVPGRLEVDEETIVLEVPHG